LDYRNTVSCTDNRHTESAIDMKQIVIIGGGESGVGAAILAKKEGWNVWLSDYGKINEKFKSELIKYEIDFEEGGHDEEKILQAYLVVKSPGVSPGVSIIKTIKSAGIPIISEIEFGARYCDAKIIGITGSNGKTTTTLLTYHLLKAAGFNVGLAGNIGDSFAKSVALQNYEYYVLEISSFQLDDIDTFRCDIAMLLNITADHLDRYDYEIMNYAKSKFQIVNQQTEDDLFIFNGRDPITNTMVAERNFDQRIMPVLEPIMHGSDLHLGGHSHFDLTDFSLRGSHNLQNLSFAIYAAIDMGAELSDLQKGIATFTNAPHRMEHVAEVDGVDFINDSKATNVDAVYYALQSMEQPTIWIVGGVDKGNDYDPIMDLVSTKVKAIICLGKNNEKLLNSFHRLELPMKEVGSAKEAVQSAAKMAVKGDSVLLSPACASFDLFNNYEHRGDLFKKAVKGLR